MTSVTSAAAPARPERPPLLLSQLGDELLARYAGRGSERAFALLYERHHQQLYRYCRSILRDDPDAQDALQSTFVRALQALRRNQRNAPLRPWLYRIAHNEAISLVRRRRRDTADELNDEHLGVGSSVEQQAADRARWRTLVDDIGLLPDRQRGALLLRELSGLSHGEIAITLHTTTAGAKQAIFEARQALAELEEGRAMRCEEVRRQLSEGDRRMLRGRRVGAHLRECAACEAFALAIPARRTQLRALAPVLPPAAAATVLTRSLHAASSHGGASGTSALATAGMAGKAASTAVAWKALAGVAILVTTAAGVSGISHLLAHSKGSAPAAAHVRTPAASRTKTSAPSSLRFSLHRQAGLTPTPARPRHTASESRNSVSTAHRAAPAAGHAIAGTAKAHGNGLALGSRGHAASAPGHSASSSRGGSGQGKAVGQPAHGSGRRTHGSRSQSQTHAHSQSQTHVHTGAQRRSLNHAAPASNTTGPKPKSSH